MARLLPSVAVALVSTLNSVGPASSQDWPTRPVTMVIPFAAGGPADTVGERRIKQGAKVFSEPDWHEDRERLEMTRIATSLSGGQSIDIPLALIGPAHLSISLSTKLCR